MIFQTRQVFKNLSGFLFTLTFDLITIMRKNYFIYIVCSIFTIIGTYSLLDSFINPHIQLSESLILKKRLMNINGILLFGGLGFIYYFLKKNNSTINRNSSKTIIAIIFACLILILNGLYLLNYPEDFKKGNKLTKIIIGYITVIFFGLGLIISIYQLIKKLFKKIKADNMNRS